MQYEHERREREVVNSPVVEAMPKYAAWLDAGMTRYLKMRGLDPETARKNLWYPSTDAGDDSPRIVIPATNSYDLPRWQARALSPDAEKRYQSSHGPRGDSVILVWPKPSTGWSGYAVVVEGSMCALAAAGLGHVGVAMMGATPPDECYDLVVSKLPGVVFLVVPDRDAPEFGTSAVAALTSRGRIARVVPLPTYAKDLAEVSPRERARVLERGVLA